MDDDQLKMTPWFPASIKPVRPGIYERDKTMHGFRVYAKWTGKAWMAYGFSIEMAERATKKTSWPELQWRGLAEKS